MRSASALVVLISLVFSAQFLNGAAAQQMVTLRVLDSNGQPVPRSLLKIGGMNVRCGPDGRVTMQLPVGDHQVEAFFMGVSVARTTIRITAGTLAQDISTRVFSLRVNLSEEGKAIPNATVRVYAIDEYREERTDGAGVAFFSQLPAAILTIHAFRDDGRISEGTITLDRNDVAFLERVFYYTVRFHLIDREKLNAANVRVQVGLAFNLTDEQGLTMVEAKKGTHKLEMTMYGLPVYSGSLTVSKDDWFNATVEASTLRVTLQDETADPYIGVATLHVGRANMTVHTDANGAITIRQIPHGEIGVSTAIGIVAKFRHEGKNISVNVITRELKVTVIATAAYMLGSLHLRVRANIGEIPLRKAKIIITAPSGAFIAVTNAAGVAEIDVPVFLENPVAAKVTVTAYGQERMCTVVSETSPLMLFILPLGFAPLILFKILTGLYRRAVPEFVPPSSALKEHHENSAGM